MKTKIQINSVFGKLLFEFEKEDNTIKKTLVEAIRQRADLRSADLRSANTDKRYIQISCIGSAKRMTTYCFDDDKIWCGCFTGNLEEFEEQVRETHDTNPQYLKEYLLFIQYLRDLK